MKWYCEKCKKVHEDEELCPRIKEQLKKHPEWLSHISDFVTVAGEEGLITGQGINRVAQKVNSLVGTNLSYEGTQQFARDIQVFRRLNEEPFSRSGHFSNPESAKSYFENVKKLAENSKNGPNAISSFEGKLTGYSQEVDWLRQKHGSLAAIFEKNTLLENNAEGVDGVTINRFTGKEISRTTIKASKNPMTANSTGIRDVKEAIRKGSTTSKDIIYAPEGTKLAAEKAGLSNPVVEKNSYSQIQESNQRLEEKIMNGQATTAPTLEQVGQKMLNGAIVGAVVAVSISSITSYIRYKNGELTIEEAFKEVTEETLRGSIVGAGMGAVTVFLPGGVIGFVAGMAVGVYFNKLCSNVLDEVFGKGAYGVILNSSGYVYGMISNLADCYAEIASNNRRVKRDLNSIQHTQKEIYDNFALFEKMKGE